MTELSKDSLSAAMEHDPSRPGKFEGEPKATVYYWTESLDGGGDFTLSDSAGESYEIFRVSPPEAEAFGLDFPYFVVSEDSNGFVYGTGLTEEEFTQARLESESGGIDAEAV